MSTNTPSEPNRPNTQPLEKTRSGIRASIQTKITLWAGLCLVLVSSILIGYSVLTLRQTSIDNSKKEAVAIAEAKANFVKNQLDSPQIVARTLASSLDAIKDPSIPVTLSRDQVNAMLRKVLIENPSFLGAYTAWEPDAFDGADAKYVGGIAHDGSGRFIPYWVRGDDGIIHTEALRDYEMPGAGDWYILPRQKKQEVTLAPLFDTIQGQRVVVASFVVPVIVKDKFYGIAGVNAPIGFVQQLVDGIDMYDGTTQAVLFTDNGTLIAVRGKPELTNQPASIIYDNFETIQSQLGTSYTRLSPDGKSLQIFSPIDIGGENSHWTLGLIIPLEKITAPATTGAIRQATIGTGLIVLALLLLWFLAGQVVRPMQVLTNAAGAVARGDWAVRVNVHSNDEAEVLANAFNTMTSQLQTVFATLENRVQERTKALSSVAEVGTAAASTLETDTLLQQVVDMTKERFGFYHAHIYLLNDAGDTLVLASGAGEVGHQMVAEGRSIPLYSEQSLVARAAREKKGVTVNDVTQTPDFLPNPLLPDTHSEMAVPMVIGEQLIGVFDVQSEVVGRFTDTDITVQTTLASQIAAAVQNARSYTKVREAEQLTRTIIDATTDVIFIKDRKHRYLMINEGYANSLHMHVSEMIGKDDLELGFPEELVKGNPEKGIRGFWTDDNLVFETGKIQHYPNDPVITDGVMHTLDTIKIPMRNAQNEIWAVLAFSRDVTERHHLEELNRKHAIEQETINLVTQKIQSTITIEEALQVAAREVGHVLGGRETIVALETPVLAMDSNKN